MPRTKSPTSPWTACSPFCLRSASFLSGDIGVPVIDNLMFTGFWRDGDGTGAQWWHVGDDFEIVAGHDRHYFDTGLRPVKMFPYIGSSGRGCRNQVVMPTGAYNYGITGDTSVYCWPCLTSAGSIRVARMSALQFGDAGSFPVRAATLPAGSSSSAGMPGRATLMILSHDSG